MNSEGQRHRLLCITLLAAWTFVLVCLAYVQLVRWQHYKARAEEQHWSRLVLPARRGQVFDRAGRVIALNRSSCSIQILPQYATNRDTLAAILSRFHLGDRRAVSRDLARRDHLFWFRRHLDYRTGDSLRQVLVRRQYNNCTMVNDDFQRLYPYRDACASVVGFVGDDKGLAGIEAEYDSILRGREGWALLMRDAVGRSFPYPSYPVQQPRAGADIYVTLDLDVQTICLEALSAQVVATGAQSGSVVVLDARSGAILGLCDYPGYDPEDFSASPAQRYKTAALANEFEPGSSFKAVICAAALESPDAYKLVNQVYDVSRGYVEIGKYKIHDSHRNEPLHFEQVFTKSSNAGCALISMQLDPALYYRIARGLGFGQATSVGLPGEASGRLDTPARLKRLRFANIAFGQGVTVTLMQLAAAYLCVANNGAYLRPYLMDSVCQSGRVVRRFAPATLRQVISTSTARRVKDILEKAVSEGTGTLAQLDGVPTCGKTGTAQKTEPWGGYSKTRSRMTFIGFFPKEEPRYVIAVLVDEPKTERFAGTAACPVFKQIGERLVRWDRMMRRESAVEDEIVRLRRRPTSPDRSKPGANATVVSWR